jgi:hypothetical protein
VLQGASGISTEVATSDIFALAPIQSAVQVYNLKCNAPTVHSTHVKLLHPPSCSLQFYDSIVMCDMPRHLL